jgi:hypothetical protein
MSSAETTTDHHTIRQWVEKRGGHPARVRETAPRKGAGGILRIDFGKPEDALERISWDDFFKTFDREKLAFLFQDERDSRFVKLVSRE